MPIEETLIGKLRREFQPRIPEVLEDITTLAYSSGKKTTAVGNPEDIHQRFPITYGQPIVNIEKSEEKSSGKCKALRVGVLLSGGQAAGGHNVITGLFDALKALNPDSVLIGFKNGPIGIMKNDFVELKADFLDKYRNTGGFDMIASGRDKIETESQQKEALQSAIDQNLDGLVIIGGDDSNTNAAVLAEFFRSKKCKCVVIGIPKTIDGDLQNEFIEISFGFDTAVKTYSEMISNICRDAVSARKAWHFIKLMGRDASQVTLDCALNTHPNIALIGEEIQKENLLLHDVTERMVDVITERAREGRNYGVVLIPEGIISFIPSMKALISFLSEMLKDGSEDLQEVEALPELSDKIKYVRERLRKKSPTLLQNFDVLPRDIQAQLLLERDPHGNIQMSQVPIENLFIMICEKKLAQRRSYARNYKFRGQGHFFGYDGRSCFPSNFDSQYCYALGRVGACLISQGMNGYMARVYDLEKDVKEWRAGAIPITMLMNLEIRHGKPKPVIRKCLVNTDSGIKFNYYAKRRRDWEVEDSYRYVGPIQFFGPTDLTDVPPMNVLLKKTSDVVWPIKKQ